MPFAAKMLTIAGALFLSAMVGVEAVSEPVGKREQARGATAKEQKTDKGARRKSQKPDTPELFFIHGG